MTSQIYGGSEYSGGYALPAESHSSAEPQRGSMGSEFSNSSHSLYENSTIDDSSQQNSRYFSNDPAYGKLLIYHHYYYIILFYFLLYFKHLCLIKKPRQV